MTDKKPLSRCASCDCSTCSPEASLNDPLPPIDKAPATCPMQHYEQVIREGTTHYFKTNIKEFARLASIQEAQCYEYDQGYYRTRLPRIEETIEFAAKCGYQRLGLAFCLGLRREARQLAKILESKGFELASVACKVGRAPKETLGLSGAEKIRGPEAMESMCNPIVQARLLNHQKVDLAILLGLCVGHDTLFIKYAEVPCTVLAVKDRVTGHNPLAALYLSDSPYYGRLKHQAARTAPQRGWKKVDITTEE